MLNWSYISKTEREISEMKTQLRKLIDKSSDLEFLHQAVEILTLLKQMVGIIDVSKKSKYITRRNDD